MGISGASFRKRFGQTFLVSIYRTFQLLSKTIRCTLRKEASSGAYISNCLRMLKVSSSGAYADQSLTWASTFGLVRPPAEHHVGVELSASNWKQLWMPPGFAHGYITLEDHCEVIYKVTDYYAPECDRGIAWDDPSLDIDWRIPHAEIILSDKDRKQPRLADISPAFHYNELDG